MQSTWKPTRRHCINCGHVMTGFRNEGGMVKLQCARCGLIMVSKRMSRRRKTARVQENRLIESFKFLTKGNRKI